MHYSSNSINFVIGDGLVRFKDEEESREKMRTYRSFNAVSISLDGKYDSRGSICTFSKSNGVMCTLLNHRGSIRTWLKPQGSK